MLLKNRIKAGALLLTLVIALILGILCTAVILLAYYNRQYESLNVITQRLTRNMESATNLVLADTLPISSPRIDTMDLFDETRDSVVIKKELWGIFQAAAITTFSNRFSRQKSFLYGSALPGYMDGCIYLADHKRPLSLIGNTKLTGDGYLSKSGVKAGFVSQRGFSYDKLLNGKIKQSEELLPPLNDIVINNLRTLVEAKNNNSGNYDLTAIDSLVRSFNDTALVISMSGPVHLQGLYLQGHLVIRSDSLITVDETAKLEQILLVAPVIRFQKGFKGSLQAIATDSVIVEGNCIFNYPSSIVLLKDKDVTGQPVIRIEDNCSFNGVLLTNCRKEDLSKTYVEIGKKTRINGILYVMGYVLLNGDVTGTILTDYFLYKSSATIYENYLVDIEINRTKLSDHFVGSAIFGGSPNRKIVQWLQ